MNIFNWLKPEPVLNWRRSPTDGRDKVFFGMLTAAPIPNAVTNRRFMSPVKDQKTIGCCVGEGSTAAVEYTERQWGKDPNFIGSELFCYYNARTDKAHDTGGYVRDSIKAMAKLGVAHESLWPFDVKKFATRPTVQAYADGPSQIISSYERLTDLSHVLAAIAAHHVVIGGFDAYRSIFNAKNGMVPTPLWGDSLAGGHCVCFCGFNQKLGIVEFKNSWGTSWGDQGYGYLPFWYFVNRHVDDLWVLYK